MLNVVEIGVKQLLQITKRFPWFENIDIKWSILQAKIWNWSLINGFPMSQTPDTSITILARTQVFIDTCFALANQWNCIPPRIHESSSRICNFSHAKMIHGRAEWTRRFESRPGINCRRNCGTSLFSSVHSSNCSIKSICFRYPYHCAVEWCWKLVNPILWASLKALPLISD